MTDKAQGYGVRAYSDFNGDSITHLCEEHFEEAVDPGYSPVPALLLIEEYEGEDTLAFVPDYACEVCGREQYKIDGPAQAIEESTFDVGPTWFAGVDHQEQLAPYSNSELQQQADYWYAHGKHRESTRRLREIDRRKTNTAHDPLEERITPTLEELQDELRQCARRYAFIAAANGQPIPRYNSLTSAATWDGYNLGVRWYRRNAARVWKIANS